MASTRYSTIAEAAEFAGISTRTIRRYIAAGLITGYRVGPRLIRVDLNELGRFISRIPSAGEAA